MDTPDYVYIYIYITTRSTCQVSEWRLKWRLNFVDLVVTWQ